MSDTPTGLYASMIAVPTHLHPDTAKLVVEFATAMAGKLYEAQGKHGYSNHWMDPAAVDGMRRDLVEHMAKGDPRDVANYCAFLWHHKATTCDLVEAALPDWVRDDESVYCSLMLCGGHSVPPEAIAAWTDEQCRQAQDWAITEHVAASDNDDVQRLSMPAWVAAWPPKPIASDASSITDLWDTRRG